MTVNSLNRGLMTILGFVRERHWCYTHPYNFGKETIMDYKRDPWLVYDILDLTIDPAVFTQNIPNVMVHQCRDCWNIL